MLQKNNDWNKTNSHQKDSNCDRDETELSMCPYLHSLAQPHVIAQNGPSVGNEVWVQEAYPLSLVVSQVPVQWCRYLGTWVSKSPG